MYELTEDQVNQLIDSLSEGSTSMKRNIAVWFLQQLLEGDEDA